MIPAFYMKKFSLSMKTISKKFSVRMKTICSESAEKFILFGFDY